MSTETLVPFFAPAWVHRGGVLSLERPRVMGIVNLTPDSFWDGGRLDGEGGIDLERAVGRCSTLLDEGADVLDLGGESTRPGALAVDPEQERTRVVPVVRALAERLPRAILSVDTRRAVVAAAALAAGAAIVNDVSGLADPEMAAVVASAGAGLVIGHLRGEPRTMQQGIGFADLLGEITDELARAVDRAVASGVEHVRIVVDPGIGFGKTAEQSAALVAAAGWLRQATGCPVMVGVSRKSFLGALTGRRVEDRLLASVTAGVIAVERGASILRVHDVAQTVEALGLVRAIGAALDMHARGDVC